MKRRESTRATPPPRSHPPSQRVQPAVRRQRAPRSISSSGLSNLPPAFTFANIDALVKFFGSNALGEVITSPEIVVRDGKKGRIQVGKDIFISTRDIAGNTVNQQISTGTIIDVTPSEIC